MTARYRRLLVAATVAVGVAAATYAPASATDPSGTAVLASGPAASSPDLTPLAHTSAGTVFEGPTGDGWLVPDTASPTATPFTVRSDYAMSACTDMLVSASSADGTVYWTDLAASPVSSGTATLAAGRTFVGAAPTGWLESEATTDGSGAAVTELHLVDPSGGDTVIATITDPVDSASAPHIDGSGGLYRCDAGGYAVAAYGTSDAFVVVGTFSGSGYTNGYTALGDVTETGTGYVDVVPVAIAGSSVVYARNTYDQSGGVAPAAFRATMNGDSPPDVAPLGDNSGVLVTAAISATDTAYVLQDVGTGASTLYDEPVAGAPTTPAGQPAGWVPVLMWPTATGFMVASTGNASGLYSGTASSVTSVWSPPAAQLSASGVALSAGRAVWSDNSQPGGPVFSRTVSGTTSLTVGATQLLGTGMSPADPTPVSDGIRTAWAATDGSLTVVDGSGGTPRIFTSVKGVPVAMSAHRVLEAPGAGTGPAVVVDLVTGGSVRRARHHGHLGQRRGRGRRRLRRGRRHLGHHPGPHEHDDAAVVARHAGPGQPPEHRSRRGRGRRGGHGGMGLVDPLRSRHRLRARVEEPRDGGHRLDQAGR